MLLTSSIPNLQFYFFIRPYIDYFGTVIHSNCRDNVIWLDPFFYYIDYLCHRFGSCLFSRTQCSQLQWLRWAQCTFEVLLIFVVLQIHLFNIFKILFINLYIYDQIIRNLWSKAIGKYCKTSLFCRPESPVQKSKQIAI